jgi:hypothetical protein
VALLRVLSILHLAVIPGLTSSTLEAYFLSAFAYYLASIVKQGYWFERQRHKLALDAGYTDAFLYTLMYCIFARSSHLSFSLSSSDICCQVFFLRA